MITMYELHIKTKYTLFQILTKLQANQMDVDFMLCDSKSGELQIRMTGDPKTYCFSFKYYNHEGDMYTYEIGTTHREYLGHMESIANILDK